MSGWRRDGPRPAGCVGRLSFVRSSKNCVRPGSGNDLCRARRVGIGRRDWEHELYVVGMLHPEPAVPFEYGNLRELPFLRLDWPVKDGVLKTEWVVAKPAPRADPHIPLSPTDEELRGV